MADKSISELQAAQSMTDDALLVVYQNGDTKSVEGALVKKYARDAVGQYMDDAAQAAGEAKAAAEGALKAAEASKENADKTAADVVVVEAAAGAERGRAVAEEGRVTAEQERASSETGRKAAEDGRTTAEGKRAAAETDRSNAEGGRESAEEARAAAEGERKAAEGLRKTGETQRSEKESARGEAETARAAAEQGRTAGEEERTSAETDRASAEAGRASAENARQAGETVREEAESARGEAEAARKEAEEARSVWEDYDPEKTYIPGNKVAYQGSSYVNVLECAGTAPTDIAHWLLIAQRGLDGEGTGDMLAGVYDPAGKAQDVFAYANQMGEEAQAQAREYAAQAEESAKAHSRPVDWMPTAQEVGADPAGSAAVVDGKLSGHTGNKSNPHGVTAQQVGADPAGSAGAVEAKLTAHDANTTKHITAAERTAWNGKAAIFAPVTVTVGLESWSGTGPWTQTVSVSGVTASDNGLGVYPVDVADGDARKLYEKAYGCLAAEAETVAGGVKLTCRDAKPEIAFQVIVKGVR